MFTNEQRSLTKERTHEIPTNIPTIPSPIQIHPKNFKIFTHNKKLASFASQNFYFQINPHSSKETRSSSLFILRFSKIDLANVSTKKKRKRKKTHSLVAFDSSLPPFPLQKLVRESCSWKERGDKRKVGTSDKFLEQVPPTNFSIPCHVFFFTDASTPSKRDQVRSKKWSLANVFFATGGERGGNRMRQRRMYLCVCMCVHVAWTAQRVSTAVYELACFTFLRGSPRNLAEDRLNLCRIILFVPLLSPPLFSYTNEPVLYRRFKRGKSIIFIEEGRRGFLVDLLKEEEEEVFFFFFFFV